MKKLKDFLLSLIIGLGVVDYNFPDVTQVLIGCFGVGILVYFVGGTIRELRRMGKK